MEPQTPQAQIPDQQAAAEPMPEGPKTPKNRKWLLLLLPLLAVALGLVGYILFFSKDKEPAQNESATTQTDQAAVVEGECRADETEYHNEENKVSFCYPSAWGEAVTEPGWEEENGHLTKGQHKIITFTNNQTVRAGLMSFDFEHNDEMGHGGVPGEVGFQSFEVAKEAGGYTADENILVDSETQFASLDVCSELCVIGDDAVHVQLSYAVAMPNNDNFKVILFAQEGDEVGDDFNSESGDLNFTKIHAADLRPYLPPTDARFTQLQRVAETVK